MQYKVEFEPWLGNAFFEGLSQGSGPHFLRGLSHGLNLKKKGSRAMALKVFRAMAQTPKIWGPEPWLKLNYVLHILTSNLVKNINTGLEYQEISIKIPQNIGSFLTFELVNFD